MEFGYPGTVVAADGRGRSVSSPTPTSDYGVSTSEAGAVREVAFGALVSVLMVLVFFSPALISGSSLAPGDGAISYLPNFYSGEFSAWTHAIYSGYPAGFDPQFHRFYLPFWLLPSYPLFVVSAYVVSASGAFLLAHRVSGSLVGSILAAMTVACSGFMVAHLGHATVIHSACWVPWILYALSRLDGKWSSSTVLIGAVCLSFLIAGGHPQISIAGLIFVVLYGFYRVVIARPGARALLVAQGAAIGLTGALLAAPVLSAFAEISSESVRRSWTEADFNSFTLTFSELGLYLAPNAYGSAISSPFGPYSGPYNLTELAVYVGWLPWIVLPLFFMDSSLFRKAFFWIGCWGVAWLATFGTETVVGKLIFELPVLGEFRAQSRYGFIVAVSAAVVVSLACKASPPRNPLFIWALVGWPLLLATWVGYFGLSLVRGGLDVSFAQSFLRYGLPVVLAICVFLSAALYARTRSSTWAMLLLAVVVADIGSFSWFYEWRHSPALSSFALRQDERARLDMLSRTGGRVLVPDGADARGFALSPNVNVAHGVRSVSGYGPLADPEFLSLIRGDTRGYSELPSPSAALLDVLDVRWVAVRAGSELRPLVGEGCGSAGDLSAVEFDVPRETVALRIVSHLSCSVDLVDGEVFATLSASQDDGQVVPTLLRVGKDSSEWAIDRADVGAVVQHSRAPVNSSFDAGGFLGHWYESNIAIPTLSDSGARLQLRSTSIGVPFRVLSIDARSASGNWQPVRIDAHSSAYFRETTRLPAVGEMPEVFVREPTLGSAWSSCKAVKSELDGIRQFLWMPRDRRTAVEDAILVEEDLVWTDAACTPERKVSLSSRSEGVIEVAVSDGPASLLAISERWHEGWSASFNGRPLPHFRAYGLIIGVVAPEGPGTLRLEFAPRSLRTALVALWIGVGFLLMLLASTCFQIFERRKKGTQK